MTSKSLPHAISVSTRIVLFFLPLKLFRFNCCFSFSRTELITLEAKKLFFFAFQMLDTWVKNGIYGRLKIQSLGENEKISKKKKRFWQLFLNSQIKFR